MSNVPPDDPKPPPVDPDQTADLVAYLDGELDDPSAQAVEAALGRDPQAQREAEALRKTWDLLDYLPQPPTPAGDFTTRTLERLPQARSEQPASTPRPALRAPRFPLFRWLAVAAVLAACVAAGYFGRGWLAGHRATPAPPPEQDPQVLADLRVIDNLRLYVHADDIDYLQLLDHPDQFGPDAPER